MTAPPDDLPVVIVICGPTAVGKTAVAISLAASTGGEIVNADSRSFYRGMDIGTAKPTPRERAQVPHHLVDIIDPVDEMSLAHFQTMAYATIDDIVGRGHRPFMVGGSAQYLNAILENWAIPEVAPDEPWRRVMEDRVERDGVDWLISALDRVDPASLARTGPNPRRIIRALEVHRATGRPMSDQVGHRPARYRFLAFELWAPRDILHARIAERIDRQIAAGLFAEVQSLLDHEVDPAWPAFRSIGYQEVLPLLRGERDATTTRAAIVHASNRLVRHQQTWFRKMPNLQRIDVTSEDAVATIAAKLGST